MLSFLFRSCLLLSLMSFSLPPSPLPEMDSQSEKEDQDEQQILWAREVVACSSQYSAQENSAAQILGEPNSPKFLGYTAATSWCPAQADAGDEFIELQFERSLKRVQQIAIFEHSNPGTVYRVYLKSQQRSYLVYEQARPKLVMDEQRTLNIKVPTTTYDVDGIRIVLKTDRVPGYNTFDAVAISDSRAAIKAEIKLSQIEYKAAKEPLPISINSLYDEIHPLVSPDGGALYFTRKNHPANKGKGPFDDVWAAVRREDGNWWKARNLGKPVNSIGHNYLNGITPDGRLGLLASDHENPGQPEKLYLIHRNGEKWSEPELLEMPGLRNRNRYSAFHLCADARHILISMDRADGFGMKDLYISAKGEDGSWSDPKNLGALINTAGEETTPYLAPDGQTLYFTTDGRYGFGSGDLYVSKRLDESWTNWSEPLNLGPSINNALWNANYSIEASGAWAYFTSYNPITESMDIYRIALGSGHGERQIETVMLLRGRVIDGISGAPLGADISWNARSNPDHLGDARSSDVDGSFQLVLPAGENYLLYAEYPNYYAVAEPVNLKKLDQYKEIKRDIRMMPIRKGEIIPMPQVQFKANSAELELSSSAELFRIASFLKAQPSIVIEIGGHTNDLCGQDYCKELSLKRARSVMQHLVDLGVSVEQLRAVGYGKEQPLVEESGQAAQKKNQRVEFKVLEDGL